MQVLTAIRHFIWRRLEGLEWFLGGTADTDIEPRAASIPMATVVGSWRVYRNA